MIKKITTITKNYILKSYDYRIIEQITSLTNKNLYTSNKTNNKKSNVLTYKPMYKFVNLPVTSKYYYNPLPTSLD
jgi:hypothetical protein